MPADNYVRRPFGVASVVDLDCCFRSGLVAAIDGTLLPRTQNEFGKVGGNC